jgi:hypothetical protein
LLKADSRSTAAGSLLARATAAAGRPAGRWLAGLLGLAALLLALAGALLWLYRSAPAFDLDAGSGDAEPFISGFHAPETAPDGLTFRWTRASATLLVPGFGRRDAVLTLRLAGAGRGGAPLPAVTVLAGGVPVAQFTATATVQPYTIAIPAALLHGGDALIELRTDEFRPPNDGRRLGVLVDAARLEAAGSAPALPPWRLALAAAAAVVATAAVGAATLGRPAPALALAAAVALALVAGLAADRFTTALWLRAGAPLVAATGLLALAGLAVTRVRSRQRAALDPAPPDDPRRTASGDWRAAAGPLWLILWAVALAVLLGVAHPQFRSSDLTMNVHKLEEVSQGRWLQTMALPGRSALPAPYPPAYYAALLPAFPFLKHDFGLLRALVTHSAALLLTALAAVAFVVAARAAGPAAGLWAALLHGFAPAGYLLVSQGNFANIFGQAAAGLVLLLLATLPDWRRPAAAVAIVAALLLAGLGHFGVFLTLLLAVPAMALLVATLPPAGRRQALTLLGLFALALLVAFLLYYRHYVELAVEVAGQIAAARAEGGAALGWNAGLAAEWRRTEQSLGWLGLPLAAAGLTGLWRSRTTAGRLTLGWLAAGAVFGLVGLALGLTVRYHFFALLGLAVAGGLALAGLGRRGRAGLALAVLLAAVWVGGGLLFWYTRVLTYLH